MPSKKKLLEVQAFVIYMSDNHTGSPKMAKEATVIGLHIC